MPFQTRTLFRDSAHLPLRESDDGRMSPTDGGPQFFVPPTSGVAENGLPIYSWAQAAAQLTRGNTSWGAGATVTYAYRSTAPAAMPSDTAGFTRFNSVQIAATEEALRLWSDVANINFVRVTGTEGYSNSATMLFANYATGESGAAAFAFYPGSASAASSSGDVWINASLDYNANPVFGEYGPHVLAHEIGHAIGLSHPGEYNGGTPAYPDNATYWQDARMFTIMSYFGSSGTGGSLPAFAAGPQFHDIAAAQRLYGANMSTRTGDTIYGFNSNTGHQNTTLLTSTSAAVFAIWDAGGNDTLDLSGYTTPSEIDLRPESFSSAGPGNSGAAAIGNIAIARGVVIENAIGGAGADTIYGNDAANRLWGGAGNDFMFGGLGQDVLLGQDGDDSLSGWDDFDWMEGGAGNDWLSGGNGNDRLEGQAGNDTLDGQGGIDAMFGGIGDDVYYVDNFYDDVFENVGEGFDLVYTLVTWGIRANVEVVYLIGNDPIALYGNDVANVLIGNSANNNMGGYGGNDWMEGGGGNDWLSGGNGDDRLMGDAGSDVLDGQAGADVLFGGSGADIFFYGAVSDSSPASYDSIRDFEVGIDKINLGAIRTGASDTWSTVAAYGNTYLFVDLGGNGTNDLLIEITGVSSISQSDLIWGGG